jgi:hypothetical protein
MQISIQSLEIIHNKTPYRFLVKKMHNPNANEIRFHCWAPEDSRQTKDLLKDDMILFEWDHYNEDLKILFQRSLGRAIKASY